MVETHRHRRYAVHRRPDPDRFTDRLMAQAIPRIQTVRRADHRAADRHDHPVPDPQVVRRCQRQAQGRRQGRGRADLQQAAAPRHHPARLQAQPASAVHAGHQVPAYRRGRGDAHYRRDLLGGAQDGRRPDARDPDRRRHGHLRRRRRHGPVRLHQGAAREGAGEGRRRDHGRRHRRHHGHDLRVA